MSGGWPLVGRGEELRSVAEVLSGAGDHRGVVITGRPGVGKTRLAREAVRAAATAGWEVRWVVATVASQAIPLGAFAAWTEALDGNPLALVRQVIAAITAGVGNGQLLVAVDDAHLLDELSVFLLHQLVQQEVAKVVATVRSSEAVPDAMTGLWKERHLLRLELPTPSRAETAALLTAALGGTVDDEVVQRMWELSRGNVVFLRGLVEQQVRAGRLRRDEGSWRWAGPVQLTGSLIELVEQQIGAVSDAVRDVVDLVAVGEPLDRAVLVTLAAPEPLEAAEQRRLIEVAGTADDDTVRLGHPLYGEVRRSQCGPVRMRQLRGRLARALSGPDARARADPVRLSGLWLDSDLPPNPEILLGGARAAFLRIDLETAGRLAGAAVQAGAGIPAQLLYAHALTLLNRGAEAEDVLATFTAAELPEPLWAQVVHARAANLMWPLARPADSWQVIEEAMVGASEPLVADLRAFRAVQLAFSARPADVPGLFGTLDLDGLGPVPAVVAAWGQTTALGDLGHVARAAEAAEYGYRRAAEAPDAAYQGVGLAEFHVAALIQGGELAQAVQAADRTCRQCAGVPGISHSVATAVAAMAALGAGDVRGALAHLSAAMADFTAYGDATGVFYRFSVVFVEALARAGRVAEAQAALERMVASRHPAFLWVESDALLAQAWVAAAAGRIAHAREIAARAAEFARGHSQWAREVWCLQTATGFGDTTVAARLAELAAMVEGPRAPLAARYARALADADADGSALAAVSADFEALGDRLAAAEAAAHAAAVFARGQHRGAALAARARAGRLAAECGAVFHPDLSVEKAVVLLSPREREIVVLVAQGMTNKAVAQTLSLSARTVEGHLYRVCTRLGLTSRGELAALIADIDFPTP